LSRDRFERLAVLVLLTACGAGTAAGDGRDGGASSSTDAHSSRRMDGSGERDATSARDAAAEASLVDSAVDAADAGALDPTSEASSPIEYGVLLADTSHLMSDSVAGIRWAQIQLGWNDLEPTQGQYASSALNLTAIQKYRAAGWRIEVSFGLHYPPSWAAQIEPWVDQNGNTYASQPNWFNPQVQAKVAALIQHVIQGIGPGQIDAIRIGGLTDAGEMIYPVTPAYDYVAYSASALAGTAMAPKNPAPQCKPPSCTATDAETFYGWYVDALAAFGNFQVAAARAAGFTGDVQWLMPGVGVRPSWRASLIANGLDLHAQYPNDYDVSAGGCEWPRIMGDIAEKTSTVVIDCTSLNDSSAANANESSANVLEWSSAHWVAYNADLLGFRKSGENKGEDGDAGMALTFAKVNAYGYRKLMWAFDGQLYDGTHASLAEYATYIGEYP
jgi:hypothetical protein